MNQHERGLLIHDIYSELRVANEHLGTNSELNMDFRFIKDDLWQMTDEWDAGEVVGQSRGEAINCLHLMLRAHIYRQKALALQNKIEFIFFLIDGIREDEETGLSTVQNLRELLEKQRPSSAQ